MKKFDYLSVILALVAIVMSVLFLVELNGPQARELPRTSDAFTGTFVLVSYYWATSIFYRLWLVAAVAATLIRPGVGGFIAFMMVPASFLIAGLTYQYTFWLVGISGITWFSTMIISAIILLPISIARVYGKNLKIA